MLRRIALVLIVLVGVTISTGTVRALADGHRGRAVIEIYPGQDALKKALASANPGDVLNIHTGIYPEHVAVTTPNLTLRSAGDGEVTVDAGCSAFKAIAVKASGTTIRGLRVVGAGGVFSPIEIDFRNVATGRVLNSVVEDTCGDAEYGINVFSSQTIRVIGNSATGFGDAGIYIGAIVSTQHGPLVIQGNQSYGNIRGIIVENSAGGMIRVDGNEVHDNQIKGIWITNSDGVRIDGNLAQGNHYSGIELDPFSDRNLIRANTASGHQYDLANDPGATGNCWVDNDYTTSLGNISC